MVVNVRANDNCVAGAEWFAPALTAIDADARSFLESGNGYSVGGDGYEYSEAGTWYVSNDKREEWAGASVVVFWDEDYFK
jgi:hypothetical protein